MNHKIYTNNTLTRCRTRGMRLLVGMMMVLFAAINVTEVNAQVNAYSFATGTGATLDAMTGSTQLVAASSDDGASVVTALPAGFTFTYAGTAYTQFSANANGLLRLGATAVTTAFSNTAANAGTNTPCIMPYFDDLATGLGGKVHFLVTGSSPTRILKVEWFVTVPRATGGTAASKFQLWLSETSNTVQIIYGAGMNVNTTNSGASVGLATSSTIFNTVNTSTHVNSTAAFSTANTVAIASGRFYTFTPPAPCTGTPTAGTIPSSANVCNTNTAATLSVTGSTAATGITFQWEQSSDNVTFINAVGGSGATTSAYTTPATLTAVTYYRAKVTCTPSTLFAYTNTATISIVNCSYDPAYSLGATYTSIMPANGGTGTVYSAWINTDGDDNTSTTQSLAGTTFQYQGTTVTGFQACINGWMTFNTANTSTAFSNNLTSTSQNRVVAPFWDDLVLTGQTFANRNNCMRYQVSGTLGSGSAVITLEWAGLERFNIAGPNLNFQVKLHEGSNIIEYVYGNFEGFDGTVTSAYSYSIGYNGSNPAGTSAGDRFGMQTAVTNHWAASDPANHVVMPDCFSKFTLTPGTYTGPVSAPIIPAPLNDVQGSETILTVNPSPCTAYCGSYFTSKSATNSGLGRACATAGGFEDDDVFFSFTTTAASDYLIRLRSSPSYDGVLELFDGSYNPITCVNATGGGLIETINAIGLNAGGNTYHIRVFHNGLGIGTSSGQFSLCVSEVIPPPTNDNICFATSLSVATTCTAINSEYPNTLSASASPQPSCGGTPDDDVWYSFTAFSSADIVTVQSGAGYNAHVQVFSSSDNTCTGTLTSLGCVNTTSTGGVETFTGSGLTPGNIYFVRVYHTAGGAGSGNFSICVTVIIPSCITNPTSPTNGGTACSGSPVILSWPAASAATGYDVYLDSALVSANQATTTYNAGLLSPGSHLWQIFPRNAAGSASGCSQWTFTIVAAPVAGVASGPATLFNGQAGLYSETGGSGGTLEWKSSTVTGGPYTTISGATSNPANISFAVNGTYYIVLVRTVAGCTAGTSNEVTTVVTTQGDNVCGAIPLSLGINGTYSNVSATVEVGEPAPGGTSCTGQTGWCSGQVPSNTVWFSFVAPASGRISLHFSPGNWDSEIALWSAATCSDLLIPANRTLLAANDDSSGSSPYNAYIDAICVSPGTTYWVQVDGYGTTTNGAFSLELKQESIDDGDACTIDACPSPGSTVTHTPLNTDDGNACTTDACDPATGTITHTPVSTDDNNVCTTDACDPATGIVSHTPISVDDNNVCTTDACDPITGPSHTPISIDDNNVCTTDACDPITGPSHTPISVDDNNVCTTDACDPITGPSHTPISVDDNNACTTDACDPITGTSHIPISVDDNNVCTTDACDPITGPSHTPISVDDNNVCTTDACDPITGPSHTPISVDDNNVCTTDACDPITGPSHTPISVDDNNVCTTDACDPLTGVSHTPVNVDDSNACTTDACDPATGIITHTAVNIDDNNACTTDACDPATGIITHTAVNIDDNNACTTDACDPATGNITYTPVNIDDGINCTADACDPATGNITHTPIQPGAITGPGQQCTTTGAGGASFSIPAMPAGTSYNWTVPTGITIAAGQGTNAIYATWTSTTVSNGIRGLMCINTSNLCGNGQSCISIDIQTTKPVQPNSISGPAKLCPGNTANYSVAAVARAASYNWVTPTGMTITSGSGTNMISVSIDGSFTGGTLSISATNVCGTSIVRTKAVALNPPATPGTISGQSSGLCNLNGVMYSIASVPTATSYLWTVTNGNVNGSNTGTSISVNWGTFTNGSVSVVSINNCGTSAARTLNTLGAPATPGIISGSSAVCAGATYPYSVSTVTGTSTYTWAAPSGSSISGQGTKDVLITFGLFAANNQVVSLNASNGCGTSANRVKGGITISICPRLESNISNTNLNVYPNPSKGNVNFSFDAIDGMKYAINIVDLTGRSIMMLNDVSVDGLNQRSIDLTSVSSGIYYVQFSSEKGNEQVRLIVE